MNKDLVSKRFAKSLKSYNQNAKIQKQMAEHLLSFLNQNSYENILEIGCGTGLLTELMLNKINFNKYYANDIVKDCKKYIEQISSDIEFICSDIEKYITNSEKNYDLIISNASLQWIKDFEIFIKILISKLKPNGTLLFSTFGKENFREIYHVLGKTLKYYSPKELENMFIEFSPVIEEEIRIIAFDTPREILKHLQLTGVNSIENVSWTKNDMFNFENAYNNYCSSSPTLTYNPIYVKILKN